LTTTTVFASGPVGFVISGEFNTGNPNTYAQAREGTGLKTAFTGGGANGAPGQVQFRFRSQDYFNVRQSFTRFVTSGIPDGDDIDSVTMSFWAFTDNRTGPSFTLEARPKAFGAAVDTGDFTPGSSLSGLALLATIPVTSIPGLGVEFNFTTNGTVFNDNINKTGNTDVMLSSSRERTGSAPSLNTNNFRDLYTHLGGDGSNRRPKLIIVHSVPPPPTIALTGTITDDDEQDIRDGGSTIILTISLGTWVAAGGTFDAERQGIIDG